MPLSSLKPTPDQRAEIRRVTEVARAMTRATSVETATDAILQAAHGLIPNEAALVILEGPDGPTVVAHRGVPEDALSEAAARSADGAPSMLEPIADRYQRRFLADQLVARGRAIGAIATFGGTGQTAHHSWLLSVLADNAAVTIDAIQSAHDRRSATKRASELERAAESSEAALATVSHDAKTPLQTISWCVELLSSTELSDEQARLVDRISACSEHLGGLMGGLYDYLKLAANRVSLVPDEVVVERVVDDALEIVKAKAQRGRRIAHDVEPGLVVLGDEARLRQVLVNLLDNALAYTPADAEIAVSASRDGASARVRVADTGPGISPDELEHLFEPFFRGEDTRHSGVGIGLAICRRLLEAMKGSIRVTSEVGRGTTFEIELPLSTTR